MPIESSREPKSFKDFEHSSWDAVSSDYRDRFGPLTSQSAPALLDAAKVGQESKVLDVCCGPGVISAVAVSRGARTTGVDFSDAAISLARSEVPGAEFRQGDAEGLPFADDSFDAVVSGFGVIHVPEPAKALSEFRRVVRPGGRVAMSTWQAPKPSNGFGLIFGVLKSHGDLNVPLPHGPDMFQFSEIERLKAALLEVGLVDVEVLEVEQAWELEDADGLLDGILEATVRGRALLRGQTEEASQAIRQAVRSGMKSFVSKGGKYRVPMPAVIGVGRK